MKKFLVVVVVFAAISMVSCKKEEAAKPSPAEKTPVSGIRNEIATMD